MPSSHPRTNPARLASRRTVATSLLLLLSCALAAAMLSPAARSAADGRGGDTPQAAGAEPATGADIGEAYGRLPLSFEANEGQADERVRFIARGVGYQMFLTPTEAVLALRDKSQKGGDAKTTEGQAADAPPADSYRVLRMKLVGANESPEASGLDEQPGALNYFVGNDPGKWRTNVRVYGKAQFRGVYKGIDLVYYGNQRQLEYDFVVAPGADPRAIKLHFEGADRAEVGGDGDLVLTAAGNEIRMTRPVVYQTDEGGARREVEGRYEVRGKNSVRFVVGSYDASKPLVIDPILSYSTFIGSASSEIGQAIATDAAGNAYVTGSANSVLFPQAGTQFTNDNFSSNAFVTKLNPTGTALVYSTLVGGGASDTGLGIAVDSSGNAYVTGRTTSTNFPSVNAVRGSTNLVRSADAGGVWAPSNAGLGTLSITDIEFDPSNASVVYAGTLGGVGIYKSTDGGATWSGLNTGATSAAALAVDPQNTSNVYATVNGNISGVIKSADGGATWSPATTGLSGGGVGALAIDPQNPSTLYAGTFSGVFKTTNGGANWAAVNNGIGFASISSIAVDPSNPQTVYAGSPGPAGVFKTTNGGASWAQAKNGLTNTLVRALVIDPSNTQTVYAGTGGGIVFKTTDGAQNWGPATTGITKTTVITLAINPSAPSTLYAGTNASGIFKTTNGGGTWTQVRGGISSTSVTTLAVSPSAPSTVLAGLNLVDGGSNNDQEGFVTKLNAAGDALVFSTYLGGASNDEGTAVAADAAGNAYVTGFTDSADFPLLNPRKATLTGGTDAFAAKFNPTGTAFVYSTYLGGGARDVGRGIAADSSGNAYVTGETASTDYHSTPGAFNAGGAGGAFISKLDAAGSSFVYSTQFGASGSFGIGGSKGFAVAVDSAGSAYVAGSTDSAGFPLVNPVQPSCAGDAFVTKFNAAGSGLVYSTCIGGEDEDHARGVAVDPAGNAYVAGTTRSRNFPVTAGSLKSRSGLYLSGDGGRNWSNLTTAIHTLRTNEIAADPSNPLTLYAGTSGGVYKSTNGGRTWAQTNAGLTQLEARAIAVDPSNPQVVFAVATLLRTSTGVGVFKSTDGGANWSPSGNGLGGLQAISDVAFDPSNTQTLYLGTIAGVYKSTDGGANWAKANNNIVEAFSLAVDPTNTQTVYVASFTHPGGVYKTTDGGANWAPMNNGLGTSPAAYVVLDPSSPQTLYVSTVGGLYKTTDGGASWTLKKANNFAGALALDSKNPSTLYLGVAGTSGSFIQKSVNGGDTWFPSGAGIAYPVMSLLVSTLDSSLVYAGTDTFGRDSHDIFVSKINAAGGSFGYSTLLGGSGDPDSSFDTQEFAFGAAADPAGNAYVTGYTFSNDFPVTPGAFQTVRRGGFEVFVSKLSVSFKVSGRVTDGGGNPLPGFKVTLGGARTEAQFTGADGRYEFVNLPQGASITVGATKTGFALAPPSHAFNSLSADQTADFVAAASATPFHQISGVIREADGTPVSGVRVTLGGSQSEFTTTDGDGAYSFAAPAGGNYTVTPALHGFLFAPPSQTVNGLSANAALDFAAARQTFVVTNTNDSGAGSLRQAMLDANATPGTDAITFNIPGAGVKTISPSVPLPILAEPVSIDGTTQPGFAGSPVIEIEGSKVSTGHGLRVAGGNSVLRGLVINRFRDSGVQLEAMGGNRVEGNIIGLDPTATVKRPNQGDGIAIHSSNSNLIGGTTPASANIIAGNSRNGIFIAASGTLIKGNYIGTNTAGANGLGNSNDGVVMENFVGLPSENTVVGGAEGGARNVISGNGREGVQANGVGTIIKGNFIGTDPTGTSKVPNSIGVEVNADGVTVGGTEPGARNVISGNHTGVSIGLIFGSTPTAVLKGNYIGTDATGAAALGNRNGVLAGNRATVGGTEPGAGNVISGNESIGVEMTGAQSTLLGNFIGTDAAGNHPVANTTGVSIRTVQATVGGAEPGARNVISGNQVGIHVSVQLTPGPFTNFIRGNYIGTNAAGAAPLPNSSQGIEIMGGTNTMVGGDAPGEGNLIAFNGTGVVVTDTSLNNSIRGNSIFSNVLLGIDLHGLFGVAPNDAGDADEGGNHLQNFPNVTSFAAAGGGTNVKGTFNGKPSTEFRLDFYSNLACDPAGNGEGARFLGSAQATTGADGNLAFDLTLAGALGANRAVTATATDPAGNTSEFSRCDQSATAGSVEFADVRFNVLEDVGSAVVRVVRRGGSRGVLSVNYSTGAGTATPGADYTAASGTLTFDEGETEKTFLVPVVNDGAAEPDETVPLTLSGTSELEALGARPHATLRIFDASTPLTLAVDIPDGEILAFTEGDTGRRNAVVPVRLNAATSHTVTLDFATLAVSGGATSGVDFAPVSGTLTFEPGSETKFVLIPIIGDTLDEGSENIPLQFSNPSGASLSFPNVFVTIFDDDAPPLLTVTDVSVSEGTPGAKAVFAVRLSSRSGRAVGVQYSTANNSATAGSDYTATSGFLTFAPGQTVKLVEVPVLADAAAEPDEVFFLDTLTDPARATVVDGRGAATIIDSGSNASLIQFDASAYAVDESAHQVQITVTRAGDTSQAATVDYQTISQVASERTDFTAALGTLRFAAGDASESFNVLVTDDRFLESPETLDLVLSNPTGAALGGPSVAVLTVNSEDAADGQSPVREQSFDTRFYVRQHYHDFLNREPDQGGLDFWSNEIDSCGADAQCLADRRINVSAAFFLSIEFQETGYLVHRTYKTAFGDTSSPNVTVPVPVVRLREFLADSARIGLDVQVGIGDWADRLEANKNAYMIEFVSRQRFLSAFPLTLSAEEFVDKLNQNAGGVLSPEERDQLVAELASAADVAAGRASVLRKVAEDEDLRREEKNRAFVLMQYFGYLRRNPDDPQDTDFRGWEFWLSKLDQFGGNFVHAQMVFSFLDSIEYKERFGR